MAQNQAKSKKKKILSNQRSNSIHHSKSVRYSQVQKLKNGDYLEGEDKIKKII